MAKRVLVIDQGCFGAEAYFQYAIVDFDGDFKCINRYRKIECNLHNSELANIVIDLFNDNNCDEIYMDIMGTSICLYDELSNTIKVVVNGYTVNAQTNHNRICSMQCDLQKRKIFIEKDAIELYDVIKYLGNEKSIYYSDMGLMKIGKCTDRDVRDKLHIILGMYVN